MVFRRLARLRVPVLCSILTLFGIQGSLASDSGLSTGSDFPFVGEATGTGVHLRAGFSVNYRSLRELESGEKVVVQQEREGWYKVTVPRSFLCWVHRQFVEIDKSGEGVILADAVNLRPTASSFYFPVDQVHQGTRVSILAEKGEWVQIVAPPEVPAWIERRSLKNLGPLANHRDEIAKETATGAQFYAKRVEERRRLAEARLQDIGLDSELAAANSRYDDLRDTARASGEEMPMDSLEELASAYGRIQTQATDPNLKARAGSQSALVEAKLKYRRQLEDSRKVLSELAVDLEDNEATFANRKEAAKRIRADQRNHRDFETGWIEKGFDIRNALPYYRLVKGGRVLAVVGSRKYNLDNFVNRKVAIRGELKPTATSQADDRGTLWVHRLEVIGGERANSDAGS